MTLSYTLQNVLLGASILGLTGGVVGSFALLRRQSLLGDAIAHAALPGVCIAFLITGVKDPLYFLIGAMITGVLGALCMITIVRGTRVKEDSAIGIVLSVFFGLGIVLLTYIQHLPTGGQAGLDRFLFGQAAALMERDVHLAAILGACAMAVVALFYKEFKLLIFDYEFARAIGLPVRRLESLLTILIVAVIVTGLQMVGVVLIVAALVTPAAAARQWTERLGVMIILAGVIGAFSGAAGALLSSLVPKMPTGPVIVLSASLVLAISLLFAPRRGMLGAALRERRMRRSVHRENLLKDLFRLGEEKESWNDFVPSAVMIGLRAGGGARYDAAVEALVARGLLEKKVDALRLTDDGRVEAEKIVRKHRLWEVFLSTRLDLPADHLHRDAEAMEHSLTDQDVEELSERLGHPTVDPHGRNIPQGLTART